jgi:hypothetical protein
MLVTSSRTQMPRQTTPCVDEEFRGHADRWLDVAVGEEVELTGYADTQAGQTNQQLAPTRT